MSNGTVKPNGVPRQIRGFTQLNYQVNLTATSIMAAPNSA